MEQANISIVIPTCNRPNNLRRLLDSLCKQTLQAKEIIIIDNGKEGAITGIVSEFSGLLPIKYLFQTHKGISSVRNKGVRASSYPIIAFLDDDCIADPCWVEAIERVFKENPDLQVLQGNTIHASLTKNIYVDIFQAEYRRYIRSMLYKTPGYVNMLNTQNFAVSRQVIARFRMPFEERLETNEDLEFYWKLKKMGIKIAFSEEMKARHYSHTNLIPFLCTWYKYGFGKGQVKRLHPDFSDGYHIDNTNSVFSALRTLYAEILASYRVKFLADILKQKRFIAALIYYPVLTLQRSAFIAGLYLGRKMRVPAYKEPLTPAELILFVTNKCNLSCRHCFYQYGLSQEKQEMTTSDTAKILRSLTRDLETVGLGGGEPFLCQELAGICRAMAQNIYLKNLYIASNGFETTQIIKTTENVLKEVFFNVHVRISLDGTAKTHNRIRRNEAAFSNAIATIKGLRDLQNKYGNLRPSAQTIISQLNIGELDELAQFVKNELKVMHVFDIIRDNSIFYKDGQFINNFYGPSDKTQLLTHNQLKYAMKAIKRIYRQYAQSNIMKVAETKYQVLLFNLSSRQALERKPLIRCSAGESIATIFPNYDVSICEAVKPIGNLKDYDFDFDKMKKKLSAPDIKRLRNCCYCTNPCYNSPSIQNMRRRG